MAARARHLHGKSSEANVRNDEAKSNTLTLADRSAGDGTYMGAVQRASAW
jgi:hypothetical protein